MDSRWLLDGLLMYLGLLVLLTFHEFGHAWVAWRCGDDTAHQAGRVSLNPLVHIDPIGTVALPLLLLFIPSAAPFIIGWAKPVPVNPFNLRNPKVDDILVTLAGPWMNLLLAIALVALARLGLLVHSATLLELGLRMAQLSLLLCFFNLIPIPPLDGSQVARVVLNMSYETYHKIAQYGFIILIVALQVPFVRRTLGIVTSTTFVLLARLFGLTE